MEELFFAACLKIIALNQEDGVGKGKSKLNIWPHTLEIRGWLTSSKSIVNSCSFWISFYKFLAFYWNILRIFCPLLYSIDLNCRKSALCRRNALTWSLPSWLENPLPTHRSAVDLLFINTYIIVTYFMYLIFGCKMQHYKPLGEERKEGSKEGSKSEAISIFALYSKKFQATHTWKFCDFNQHFIADAYIKKKKSRILVLPPLTALFGHPVHFFLL